MFDKNICPVCNSDKNVLVDVTDPSGYVNLVYAGYGGATLRACLDCGTVYINRFDRERMLSRVLMEEKRRKKG